MSKTLPLVAVIGAVAFAACESFGQAMTAQTDVVARAAGHEFTVDEAASTLALNPQIPANAEVVDAIANLWVDYMLLATAVAKDSTLESFQLETLIQPGLEQDMVWRLRDKVIQPDTSFTDAELRAEFEKAQPGLQIRARHILLRMPPDATPAQRDSLMTVAKRLQAQAAGGADFAALAREHSQDGSAPQGGDLGLFARGQMVQPFEEAAFALQPGQVSGVVETPFGLHIIKVEDRVMPDFAQLEPQFRNEMKVQAQADAEEAYVKQLTEPLNVQVDEDALDVARDLAMRPNMHLAGRAASRVLASYEGGALTAAEFQDLMRRFAPGQRIRYSQATDEQMTQVLDGLAKNEILINEARKQGFTASAAQRDSLVAEARLQLDAAVNASGLKGVTPQEGETQEQAIERKVNSLMAGIVRGEQSVLPLGPLTFFLRDEYDARIFDSAFPAVIEKMEATRQAQAPTPGIQPQPQPQPPPADTGAGRN